MLNLTFVKWPTILLILILLVAFGIRVYNLNYNSPFLDEALYILLGEKVLGGHWQEENPFGWVGGMPLFYPPLAAFFSKLGGVVGARFLNVLLGTLSVYLIYEFSKALRITNNKNSNQIIGLIAAALLSVLAIPVFLSRLAIYDMLSFTLFLGGLVFLQQGIGLQQPALWYHEHKLFVAAVFFFLSFLAKYVTLTFFPLVAVWALLQSYRVSKKALRQVLTYFVVPLAVASIAYIVWNFQALRHFNVDQIGDSQNNSRLILMQYFKYAGLPLLMALLGGILMIWKKQALLVSGLLLAALSVPVVHLLMNSSSAVHQHTFLSLIFLLPLVGYLLWYVVSFDRLIGTVATLFLVGLVFTRSFTQVQSLQTTWPNTTAVMRFVQSATTSHEKVLSFEDDVTVLMLKNLPASNITGIYNFQYKGVIEAEAYHLALADGHFNFVLFNEHNEGSVGSAVKESLTSHYQVAYNMHPYVVYKRQH